MYHIGSATVSRCKEGIYTFGLKLENYLLEHETENYVQLRCRALCPFLPRGFFFSYSLPAGEGSLVCRTTRQAASNAARPLFGLCSPNLGLRPLRRIASPWQGQDCLSRALTATFTNIQMSF